MFKQLLSMVLLAGMLAGQNIAPVYAATICDQAQFISDITVPDGAAYAPGAKFTKTWRFMNAGTCAWTTSYNVVFAGGDVMGSTAPVKLPVNVPPGQMLDISVNLTAPATPGHYKGLWKFSNASGVQFGIGDSATDAFWVDINVIATDAVIYDFVANAPYAQWKSGAGILPYPITSGDDRGFAYPVDRPHLEDDSFDSLPGLITVPQNKYNGYIQATYPEIEIQQGDKLQTLVNCEFNAKSCNATFRINYILPNGTQRTLWQWRESYDKKFYRANIDLTALKGQRVRFVLMLMSGGLASGDRALWGSPRIIRTGSTLPPAPPATLTPLPPLTPTATPFVSPEPTIAPYGCDRAAFVTDVNVPDGTTFTPNTAFSKTWRLRNSGSCKWTTDYKVVYYSGSQMSAPTSINMPLTVYPGQTVDLTINMVTPNTAGNYRGFWILSNANGTLFGIGTTALNPFWLEINVAGESTTENGYDFWANACSAEWKSAAGALPCPGTEGDPKGFIVAQNHTELEDGTVGPAPSLLMSPQNLYNGYIKGYYPALTVQPGDRFRANVGCEKNYSCYVTFRLDYMLPNGYTGSFWTLRESNNKLNSNVDIDLSPLAGRSVRFILTILATGSATNDRVRWTAPYILRAGGSPPPPPTTIPSPTITPIPGEWTTYANTYYNFEYKVPPQAQITNQQNNFVRINLPIQPGTNLGEKYLETVVTENASSCQTSMPQPPNGTTETVNINGTYYLKQTGGEAAAGNLYTWVAYSTFKGNNCVSMGFVLHSLNAGSFDPPIPVFDEAAESAVFAQIMQTLLWSITPTVPAPSVTPSNPAVLVPSPTIRKLYMQDTLNGWALGEGYVIRTYDGGATWYNVLPNITATSAFFTSSSTGWVINSSNILYRTNDGGATWTQFTVPFNSGQMQFIDSNNGFVLFGEASGMQKQAVDLYQTSDGGATWILKYTNNPLAAVPGTSLPFSGHKNGMSFRDTTTGWVGGDTPTNGVFYLYRTSDSGVTWSQVQLQIPAGYEAAFISTTAPKFFNVNDAILPVWMTTGTGVRDLFLYTTRDGGNTWTISTGFARNAETTDFVSLNDAFSWNWANTFHATNNAGASWRTVTPNLNFADAFRGMDFVNMNTGWLIEAPINGSTPLYRTLDGGATWTLLSGNPPSSPTSTPTAIPPTAIPPTATPTPTVTSLNAKVTASLLSCRYGPGVEYLYLYALNQNANIKLIGRTDANNWVWVSGTNKCWVNANYLTISGDRNTLPIVYPGIAKLPVSPYYPGPSWASAVRNGNSVGVTWEAVPISAGKYEDAEMHQYILEVWRCEAGKIIFETLGTNSPSIVVAKDEPGCSIPSHGRVFVQEKHGYGGPIEVPWPQHAQAPTATPFVSPSAFAQSVVSALNTKDFNTAKSKMDASFIMAFWQSQGFASTPDQAIQQLQTNYLGATPLTADANKDLNSLLGGSNPYTIMGLDPARSHGLFVSGWGLNGQGEAILYMTQRTNGSWYWHSVLIAPTRFVQETGVTHEAFCADSRVPLLIAQLKAGVNQSNGSLFSTFVSPSHGLDVRLWAYQAPVNFSASSVNNIYSDTTVYNWGGGPSGMPDFGTFNNLIQPRLLEVLNAPNMETYCDSLDRVYPLANPWPYPDIRYYNLYKPGTPGVELDFRTWLIGFEYINGQPYLHSMVTIPWEP